jgi:hypothetical protein
MRSWLTATFSMLCACTIDTQPIFPSVDSEQPSSVEPDGGTAGMDATAPGRPGAPAVGPGRNGAADSGTRTSTVTTPVEEDAGQEPVRDSGMVVTMMPPPTMMMMPIAGGDAPPPPPQGGMTATAMAGASASAGAGGSPSTEDELTAVLAERAATNMSDAFALRTLISTLDSGLPANAASTMSLLTIAVTSFDCPDSEDRACEVICKYAVEHCLSCLAEERCRTQLYLVCGDLTQCL